MPKQKYFTPEARLEGRRISNRRWREAHRDEIRAEHSRYQHANLDKIRAWRRDSSRGRRVRFTKLKCVARKRGLEMTLTLEQFLELNSKPCEYCGENLPATGYGIDRKENSKGYTPENSIPCCTRCNSMKSAFLTYEEMKLIWQLRLFKKD